MATGETKSEVKHVRGILKNTTSFDKEGYTTERVDKEMKWDEMNILATYHPADKDYGHQKITDPPTPFSRLTEEEKSGDEGDLLDSQLIADKLLKKPKATIIAKAECSDDDEEDDEHLTEEERAKKMEFMRKRKLHYNEFQAVKMHQQMHSGDEDEEEDEQDAVVVQPAMSTSEEGICVDMSELDGSCSSAMDTVVESSETVGAPE